MRFPLRLLFYLLLMIFVLLQAAACVPQPESSLIPTGTETPIPQPSPTALPQTVSIGANPGPVDIPKYIPTPVPENYPAPENYTSIPTIKPTATIILPTETPSLIPDCYVLGGYPTQFGSVVENSNLCELEMTLDSVNGKVGYRLFYPKDRAIAS